MSCLECAHTSLFPQEQKWLILRREGGHRSLICGLSINTTAQQKGCPVATLRPSASPWPPLLGMKSTRAGPQLGPQLWCQEGSGVGSWVRSPSRRPRSGPCPAGS